MSLKSLKNVIAQEVREVEKTAAAFAVDLGFQRKTLDDDFWFEVLSCPKGTGPAGGARSRCLDALATILEVDTHNSSWIQEVERALEVLRRDVPKSAPRPDAAALRRAAKGDQGMNGDTLRHHQLGQEFLARKIVPITRARPRHRALKAARPVSA